MYAILDIETTGGQFNEEGITEIAIYRYDGHQIVDQFISLVNPEIPIQPFVAKLTGINNAMLQSAPKFYEVAKRIIEITADCILVAHNTDFDYRILRTEFRRLGYDFNQKTLCTVELSKKLLPEQTSYSLGKLVRALGIPMADRHRASGDAMATVKLFKLLLNKDLEKEIIKNLIKSDIQKGIAPRLMEIVDNLPSKTGVYYIHNEEGKIIFIGNGRNIKKRVNQHFTGITSSAKKIQAEVFTVTYEETGNELIAMLKEAEEININKPIYNRRSPKIRFHWSLYAEKDIHGYLQLKIQKTDRRKKEILSFANELEANNALLRFSNEFKLCQKLTSLSENIGYCNQYALNQCDGACNMEITAEEYNQRVQEFILKNSFENKSMILIDRGRNLHEKSAILIEKGIFKGYSFFDLNYQVTNIDILKNIITTVPSARETSNLIQAHIRKGKGFKIINF